LHQELVVIRTLLQRQVEVVECLFEVLQQAVALTDPAVDVGRGRADLERVVEVVDRFLERALLNEAEASVAIGLGVGRLQLDGTVEVLDRQLVVIHLLVDQPAAFIYDAVVAAQAQDLSEAPQRLGQVVSLLEHDA